MNPEDFSEESIKSLAVFVAPQEVSSDILSHSSIIDPEYVYTDKDAFRAYLPMLLSKLNENVELDCEDYSILASLALKLMHRLPEEDRIKEMESRTWYPTFISITNGLGWIKDDKDPPSHIKLIKQHLSKNTQKPLKSKDLLEYLIRRVKHSGFNSEADLKKLTDEVIENLKGLDYFEDWPFDLEGSIFRKSETSGSGEHYIEIPSIPWESNQHKQTPFLYSLLLQLYNPQKSNESWLNLREDDEIKDKTLWSDLRKLIRQKLQVMMKSS